MGEDVLSKTMIKLDHSVCKKQFNIIGVAISNSILLESKKWTGISNSI